MKIKRGIVNAWNQLAVSMRSTVLIKSMITYFFNEAFFY